jgi:hypothetical protein
MSGGVESLILADTEVLKAISPESASDWLASDSWH